MAVFIVFSTGIEIEVTDATARELADALRRADTWPEYPLGRGRALVNPALVAYVRETPSDDRPSSQAAAADD